MLPHQIRKLEFFLFFFRLCNSFDYCALLHSIYNTNSQERFFLGFCTHIVDIFLAESILKTSLDPLDMSYVQLYVRSSLPRNTRIRKNEAQFATVNITSLEIIAALYTLQGLHKVLHFWSFKVSYYDLSV